MCSGLLAAGERDARANGFEFPENGTELMGRGGAWTARADNPLAAAYNPAGLAGQPTALLANANLVWQSLCFQRNGRYLDAGQVAVTGTDFKSRYMDAPYPKVCKENGAKNVNVIPQLMFNYRVNEKLGIAIGVVSPSAAGKAKWPERVETETGEAAPAPQRFLLLEQDLIIIHPTIAAGYEIAKGLRFGAAFQPVFSHLKFSNVSQGLNERPAHANEGPNIDLKADLKMTVPFTPAFVLGALYSPHDDFDVGAMFRWSADVVSKKADVSIVGPMYGIGTADSRPEYTPTLTEAKVKEFRAPQPWELRLGFRWHPQRAGGKVVESGARRDFLASDAYDIELDVNYAHNSQFDTLGIYFDPGIKVKLGPGTPKKDIPTDANVPHRWKDTVAFRLGGEYVAIPDRLGVRAGGFLQTRGQDPDYLGIDFVPAMSFGAYLGGTFRVSPSIDLSFGYGHVFLRSMDNGENGKVFALNADVKPGVGICGTPDPYPDRPPTRSCFPVNSGKVSGGYNMFSLGITARL